MSAMPLDELLNGLLMGDQRSLSRLLTLVDRDGPEVAAIVEAIRSHTGRAHSIGVTGPPGSGKSTLVDHITYRMRERGLSVGIVAVDPSSPFSGGAFLGDRVRMERHYLDGGVFIRSMASRGEHGGLSKGTRIAVKLLDASGKDIVIVETVGVGQTELDIMNLVDTVVVVLVPEAGDAIQVQKAGLSEVADIFVVNKKDRDGARKMAASLNSMINLGARNLGWRIPVILIQANKGDGVSELESQIDRHRVVLGQSPSLQQRRMKRRRREFMDAMDGWLTSQVSEAVDTYPRLRDAVARVEADEIDPVSMVRELVEDRSFVEGLLSHLGEAK
jgi:LAO/AO transport system kinase